MPFTSGTLTDAQARELNQLAADVRAFKGMSGAPPVTVNWGGTSPRIMIDQGGVEPLVRITAVSTDTPPVHTGVLQTRQANPSPPPGMPAFDFPTDTAPQVTFSNILNPLGSAFVLDQIVSLIPIVDQPGPPQWYWGEPIPLSPSFRQTGPFGPVSLGTGGLGAAITLPAPGTYLVWISGETWIKTEIITPIKNSFTISAVGTDGTACSARVTAVASWPPVGAANVVQADAGFFGQGLFTATVAQNLILLCQQDPSAGFDFAFAQKMFMGYVRVA